MTLRYIMPALFPIGMALAVQTQASCWMLLAAECCAAKGRPKSITCGAATCFDEIEDDEPWNYAVPAPPMQFGKTQNNNGGVTYCRWRSPLCKENMNPPTCYWPSTIHEGGCLNSSLDGYTCSGGS